MPATTTEKPVSTPRKGQAVLINGVRHEVLRRYCHGCFFDLSLNGTLVCMDATDMVDGLRSGRIVVVSANPQPKRLILETYSDFAVVTHGDVHHRVTGLDFVRRARELALSLRAA